MYLILIGSIRIKGDQDLPPDGADIIPLREEQVILLPRPHSKNTESDLSSADEGVCLLLTLADPKPARHVPEILLRRPRHVQDERGAFGLLILPAFAGPVWAIAVEHHLFRSTPYRDQEPWYPALVIGEAQLRKLLGVFDGAVTAGGHNIRRDPRLLEEHFAVLG